MAGTVNTPVPMMLAMTSPVAEDRPSARAFSSFLADSGSDRPSPASAHGGSGKWRTSETLLPAVAPGGLSRLAPFSKSRPGDDRCPAPALDVLQIGRTAAPAAPRVSHWPLTAKPGELYLSYC